MDFIKRNKTLVSRITNDIKKGFNTKLRRSIVGHVKLPDSMKPCKSLIDLNVDINVYGIISSFDVVVEQYNDKVVFGIKPNKINLWVERKEISTLIKQYVDTEDLDDIKEVKGYEGNLVEVRNKLTNELYEKLCNIIEKEKECMNMNEDAFPFIKDREIIPIFICGEDRGDGYYINKRNIYSYKEGHSYLNIRDFRERRVDDACERYPKILFNILLGKDLKIKLFRR